MSEEIILEQEPIENEVEKDGWQKIVDANKLISTIDIKGKEYAEVNQRIKAFRYLYPKGLICPEVEKEEGESPNRSIRIAAFIYDENHVLLAKARAEENESSSFINKTSYVENCETSAIGRALGLLGLGVDTSIASYEEVKNAQLNQDKQDEKKPTFKMLDKFQLGYADEERAKIRKYYKVDKDGDLPRDIVEQYINERKDMIKKAAAKRKEEVESDPNYIAIDSDPLPFY